jgi:hypothetical protein
MTEDPEHKCRKCGTDLTPKAIRCPTCRRLSSRGNRMVSMIVVLSLIVASLSLFFILNGSEAQDPVLMTDRPTGSGANDFWFANPSTGAGLNSTVDHPSWVINALEKGPVLIFAHIEGCMACAIQEPICVKVNGSHEGNLTYFDLLGGRNDLALNEALDAYDPSGGSHLVPLVVVINQVQDGNGSAKVVWHSWEGIISLASLDSWINDALAHHVIVA